MKHFIPAFKMILFMTLLLGIAYPLLVTGIGKALFPNQANGGLIKKSDRVVGSDLLGQKFEGASYFWGRPSGIDYNPMPSGGTNLGQASEALKKVVEERRSKLKLAHSDMQMDPPQDLLFASGSGLDPHISPEAAEYQIQRVAKARSLDVTDVKKIVKEATSGRQLGLFGEPRVNVFALNMALDKIKGLQEAPEKLQDK